jgi:hypothetical protein
MHLEVPNKLPNGIQVDKGQFKPRQTTSHMAWSPRKFRGNKRPTTKLGNSENKVEGGDEL